MNYNKIRYIKEHEWIRIEGNVATIGITCYAQEQITDIVFVKLSKIGKIVKQSEIIAILESVKALSDVYSPVSGEVMEVN